MQIRDLYSKAFQSFLHFQDEHVFVFTNQNQPYPITAFSVFQCAPQKYIEGSLNILIFILIWPILKNKQTNQPQTTIKQNKKPTKPEDFTLIIIFCSLWKLFLSTKWAKQRSCRAPCCYSICISGHTTLSGFVHRELSPSSVLDPPSSEIAVPVLRLPVTGAEPWWQADTWKAEFTGTLKQNAISVRKFKLKKF